MLASIVTDRVAAEMGRVLLGEPSALGEIRQERRRRALRVTATDAAGETLTRLPQLLGTRFREIGV
jgi:hypothetical protein